MRPTDEDTFWVEYWDEYLHTFGVDAYIVARWEQHPQPNFQSVEEEKK